MTAELSTLFSELDITRVVFVDDDFMPQVTSATVLAAVRHKPDARNQLSSLLNGLDLDPENEALPRLVQQVLDRLEDDAAERVAELLGDVLPRENSDVHRLQELIPANVTVLLLSPAEWAAQQAALVSECTHDDKTLFLFDEDLNAPASLGFEFGSDIVKALAAVHANSFGVSWFCGILSNKLHKGDELTTWRSLALERQIELKFFMPISKENLDDPGDFYSAVYRTLINTYCESIKDLASSKLADALDAAKRRFAELDPIDFEHMVVKSSEDEGVSEIETLIRLYGILHRDEVKLRILAAPVFARILDSASAVKKAVDVDRKLPSISRHRILRLRNEELYEASELVNGFRDPIRNGDLFEIDGHETYVLIAQPCDVMVRKDGKRARENTFKVAVLAPLESFDPAPPPALSFFLPNFGPDGRDARAINFSKATVVNLNVLDLTVLSELGDCRIDLASAAIATHRFPTRAWDRRAKELVKYFSRVAADIEKARTDHSDEVASLLAAAKLPRVSPSARLAQLGTYADRAFSYPIRRSGRIRDPLAVGLLAAYSRYLSRDAFDHDFSSGGKAA